MAGVKKELRDPVLRFMDKVRKENGCWIWTSTLAQGGYATFSYGGRKVSAHRWAYAYFVGPIPPRLHVLHTCDNPSCVNPAHLFTGTRSDNMTDCAMKGRVNTAKLSPDDVLSIRSRYGEGDVTYAELAAVYGVTPGAIGHAVRGHTWREVNLKQRR
jgi:hypothetical protein